MEFGVREIEKSDELITLFAGGGSLMPENEQTIESFVATEGVNIFNGNKNVSYMEGIEKGFYINGHSSVVENITCTNRKLVLGNVKMVEHILAMRWLISRLDISIVGAPITPFSADDGQLAIHFYDSCVNSGIKESEEKRGTMRLKKLILVNGNNESSIQAFPISHDKKLILDITFDYNKQLNEITGGEQDGRGAGRLIVDVSPEFIIEAMRTRTHLGQMEYSFLDKCRSDEDFNNQNIPTLGVMFGENWTNMSKLAINPTNIYVPENEDSEAYVGDVPSCIAGNPELARIWRIGAHRALDLLGALALGRRMPMGMHIASFMAGHGRDIALVEKMNKECVMS